MNITVDVADKEQKKLREQHNVVPKLMGLEFIPGIKSQLLISISSSINGIRTFPEYLCCVRSCAGFWDYNDNLEKSSGLGDPRQMSIPPNKQISMCSIRTKEEQVALLDGQRRLEGRAKACLGRCTKKGGQELQRQMNYVQISSVCGMQWGQRQEVSVERQAWARYVSQCREDSKRSFIHSPIQHVIY